MERFELLPEAITSDPAYTTQMIVDYVKVYPIAEPQEAKEEKDAGMISAFFVTEHKTITSQSF